jgi:glucose/arabinose dehydrogenase
MRRMLLYAFALVGALALAPLSREPPHKKNAAEIEAIMKGLRLPQDFSIWLYALAPGARTVAVGPTGKAIFIGTGAENTVYVLTSGVGRAAVVERLELALTFDLPHGLCFSNDGTLFIVERNRVLGVQKAEEEWRQPHARVIVAKGELIPRQEESDVHTSRVCRVGPDGKLYISLGQPYDVAPREKLAFYERTGVGGIIRMNLDGSKREVFARGVRNSVGMDFNPADGSLWFTDNQSNEMGDDSPPGELNRAPIPWLHFGFPWYGGGHVRTPEYAADEPPPGVVFPEVEEEAHAADLGMIFYTGEVFPKKYRGGVFSAQHGSSARKQPVGARLMFTRPGPGGIGGVSEPFVEGWNTGVMPYLGRPVDVAETPGGDLLVTDDENGAVYRISYRPSVIAGE